MFAQNDSDDDDDDNEGDSNSNSNQQSRTSQCVGTTTQQPSHQFISSDPADDYDTNVRCSKISKKGVETVQEILTEFLLFVTSEAEEKASECDRNTIQGCDVLAALKNLGFDHYYEICHRFQQNVE